MELKNIFQINTLSEDDFIEYKNCILSQIPSNYPWDAASVENILGLLWKFTPNILFNDYITNYLNSFIIENINNTRISYLDKPFMYSDDIPIIKWVIGDNSWYLPISRSKLDEVLTSVTLMTSENFLPDNYITRAELEACINGDDIKDTIFQLLRMLGLINIEDIPNIIPEITNSSSSTDNTARFSSALWFEEIQKKSIIVAGLGGIGSYVAFLLSRMSPSSLYLYDNDRVETVNLAGQLFSTEDVGKFKVDAISYKVASYSKFFSVFAIRERFTEDSPTNDIMICGFDNMEARKTFFQAWVSHVKNKAERGGDVKECLFIDGRLAAEEFQVLCIRGDDDYNIDRYNREFLFSDDEADETLCSYKQTSYMANMIGSIIVNLFTNFVANSIVDGLRELPFLTTYTGDTMKFKLE